MKLARFARWSMIVGPMLAGVALLIFGTAGGISIGFGITLIGIGPIVWMWNWFIRMAFTEEADKQAVRDREQQAREREQRERRDAQRPAAPSDPHEHGPVALPDPHEHRGVSADPELRPRARSTPRPRRRRPQ